MCFCMLTALFAFNMRVKASIPVAVFPWEVVFEDANMIFYMTPPQLPHQSELDFFNYPDISEERMQIKSGLYYNETPLRNIYYVDIIAHKNHVIFSACGNYFATIQNTTDNFDGETLGGGLVNFFDNGILIKSYGVKDLINFPFMLPWTSAGVFWRHDGSRALDHQEIYNPETNELTITTYEQRVFVFDITTGRIIQSPIPIMFLFIAIGFGVAMCVFILIVTRRRKKLAVVKNLRRKE